MLNEEDLSRIVRDEVENLIRKGKISTDVCNYYYILLNGKTCQAGNYNKEVAEGKRSPNDIYAYVDIYTFDDFDDFLFHIDYLEVPSVDHTVEVYLRKAGFTITDVVSSAVFPPSPNLKYYIHAVVELNGRTPEYLVIDIYDIDSLARTLHIPQIVEQRVGSKPREITIHELFNIYDIVDENQPLLAGYTYHDAWGILFDYYIRHEYKDEANRIVLAYSQLFPSPYRVCYEWKAGIFTKIDCLKLELRSFSF